ncbi:FAD-binding protein [Streptomyces sp. NBC_00442]|uniref:FAD-binding oxidoreductase n=1 Tax=Streptomyces sp. NBC_00442 TaxID=2903651 RepID=UPI002E1BB8BA
MDETTAAGAQAGPGVHRRALLIAGATAGGSAVLGGAGPARAAGTGGAAPTAPGAAPSVVTPGDARYPDLVRGWNQRWVGRPDAVHVVGSAEQARDVVQSAVRDGKRLSVRGGGHCYEDFVFDPDVRVVLDMSRLNQVFYDPARRAFAVEAGAQLLDVYENLYRFWGVTVPAGICFSVGAGGHVSGGGWGMLCRKHGLVVDHLQAVEVIVVDASGTARLVTASRDSTGPLRELWWAHTGGGGGNFGVVTRYWFRTPGARGNEPSELLPAPPPEVLLHATSWSWDALDRADLIRLAGNYGAWHAAHRDPGTAFDGLCSYLVLGHRSGGSVSMVTQVDASDPDASALLAQYLEAVTQGVRAAAAPMSEPAGEHPALPGFASPRRIPWLQATRHLGTTNALVNDPTLHSDFKSAYFREGFSDAQLASLYDRLSRTDSGNATAGITLSSFGGRINSVAQDATASAHRDAAFKALWGIWWSDPSEESACLDWIRSAYAQVFAATGGVPVPNGATDGCYVNYPDADLSDPRHNTSSVPWHALYYKANYPRLQRVKDAWDPRDVFRHRQSVRPSGA